MRDQQALSIGEVINLLSEEFPDISVSKVRFLEQQGLVNPSRSSSGYRQFFPDDLKRLRFILEQQRDHFLPLKVIKSKLTDWERGDDATDPAADLDDDFFGVQESVTAEELMRRSGLNSKELESLMEHGVAVANAAGAFDDDTVAVAREARLLFDHGLDARHLRTLALGAGRQADLLRQLTAPHRRLGSPDARRATEETMVALARSFAALSLRLLRRELRQILDE